MSMTENVVVLGASPNPSRYSNMAVNRLKEHGHSVYPVGVRDGEVAGLEICKELPKEVNVDTISLYVAPQNMGDWREKIEDLKPKRVIFNPGTEDPKWQSELMNMGIEPQAACTLVLLSIGNY